MSTTYLRGRKECRQVHQETGVSNLGKLLIPCIQKHLSSVSQPLLICVTLIGYRAVWPYLYLLVNRCQVQKLVASLRLFQGTQGCCGTQAENPLTKNTLLENTGFRNSVFHYFFWILVAPLQLFQATLVENHFPKDKL